MIITTHQPEIALRSHLMQRAFYVDKYVVQPDCQFVRKWKFQTIDLADPQGNDVKVSIPLVSTGKRQTYREKLIAGTDWQKQLRKTMERLYSKAPFGEDAIGLMEPAWARTWGRYLDLSHTLTRALWNYLEPKADLLDEGSLSIPPTVRSGDREVATCNQLRGSEYHCGIESTWEPFLYEWEPNFTAIDARVTGQRFQVPEFAGRKGTSIATVDMIAWLGPDVTRHAMKKPSVVKL